MSLIGLFSDHNQTRSGRTKVPKPHGNVSGFTDPTHELLPPTIPVWRTALLKIDVNKDQCHSCAKVVGINGLAFPHVDLFTSVDNLDKWAACFRAWLRLRDAIKTWLAIPNFQPPMLLHQEWHALLMLPYLWDSGNTTSKGTQVREKVKHLMSGCFDEFSDDLNLNELQGFWRGKEFGTLADTDKQEILWELSEMGFHLEMHALDCRVLDPMS